MAAPTNISAGTAIAITSLPYSNIQQVTDSGVCYTVWYKYTGISGSLAVSVSAENSTGSGSYIPDITFYESNGTTEISAPNTLTPMQIGTLISVDYYIKISPNVPDLSSALLEVTVVSNPTAPIVAGYILITDDGQSGWNTQGKLPGVIFDPATGEVVNIAFPLAQGDYGDILPSGIMALEHFETDELVFYEPDLDEIIRVDLSPATDFIKIRANNSLGVFLISVRQSGVTKFKIFNSAGTELLTKNTTLIANPRAIALLNDNDTVIYAMQTSAPAIKTWILSTNVAGSDLVAGITDTFVPDILVMDNNDILVMYTDLPDFRVIRYNSSGVAQQTYELGTTLVPDGAFPRMGYDGSGSQTAFVTWSFPSVGVARVQRVQISDGVVLTTSDTNTYEEGVSDVTDPADFGPSNSCPIITLGSANVITENNNDGTIFVTPVTPPEPEIGSGVYQLVPNKRTDTLYTVARAEADVKIPNPFIKTFYTDG